MVKNPWLYLGALHSAHPPPAAKRVGVTLLLAINQLARAPTIASQIAHIITETTIAPTPCPV